jgi:hypothetical protein
MKSYKGEKYIYLLMGYTLAMQSKDKIKLAIVGDDNGYTDGYHYQRNFTVTKYQGKILLHEVKSSKSCADYSRTFEVRIPETTGRITISDYINESGENCGANNWKH